MADDLKHQEIEDFYRSSNGDRWRLVRDTETGHRIVRHEPNLSSGGRVTETPVEAWLDRTGASPENAALRSLLERPHATGRSLASPDCSQSAGGCEAPGRPGAGG